MTPRGRIAVPLSERERKVLEQLEQEFHPSASSSPSSPAPSRWSGISRARRLAAVAVGLPAGLLSMIVGLSMNDAGGIVLAVVAYVLIVGSVWTFFNCTPRARAVFARVAQWRPAAQPPRYFR